jgi:microcystin-dependent protein
MNISLDFKSFLLMGMVVLVINYIIMVKYSENFSKEEAIKNVSNLYGESKKKLIVENAYIGNFKGIVVAWSGRLNDLPNGWVLCNGNNLTPDLRDRFIVGAGNNYKVNDTGGKNKVKLKQEHLPSHKHPFKSDLKFQQNDNQAEVYDMDSEHHEPGNYHERYVKGTTDAVGQDKKHENRPPYYALAYIMFIGGN